MPGCTIQHCNNRCANGFKMYRFPTDSIRRLTWISKCGKGDNWQPTKNTAICEVHFDASQFESHRADGVRKLKPNSVPTLFGMDSQNCSNNQHTSIHDPGNTISSLPNSEEGVSSHESTHHFVDAVNPDHSYSKICCLTETNQANNYVKKSPVENMLPQCKIIYREILLQKRLATQKINSKTINSSTVNMSCCLCKNKQKSLANNSKTSLKNSRLLLHKKLNVLLTPQELSNISENGDCLCSRCIQLLHYLDRIEVEANTINSAIVNTVRQEEGIVLEKSLWDKINSSATDGVFSDSSPEVNPTRLPDRRSKGRPTINLASTMSSDDNLCNASNPLQQNQPLQNPIGYSTSINNSTSEVLQCRICNFQTQFKSFMIYHLRQHIKDSRSCDFCNVQMKEELHCK